MTGVAVVAGGLAFMSVWASTICASMAISEWSNHQDPKAPLHTAAYFSVGALILGSISLAAGLSL